ncbi:DUF7504 family protein [Halorussus marinus]|uniref:DUF7504 family protein n=1 Tax=Halorussus marinus TaxID=2505976 RepID=UPI001092C749|nr:hypothetical protein [Halorussus marinus]
MGGEQRTGEAELGRFRRRLLELKREGCNVLVVGDAGGASACRRLLGDSSAGPRYRVFVAADADRSSARDRLDAIDEDRTRDAAAVVVWRPGGRDAAGGSSASADSLDRDVTVESADLRALGAAVAETVEALASGAERRSPARLRLCFDSLAPVVDGHGVRDARRFLLGVTETVERVDGMGHYHLPGRYDRDALAALFDGTVEVRRARDGVEQRWRVDGMDTGWIRL